MDHQKKENHDLNNTPLSSKTMSPIDDDQTEELLTATLTTEDKKRKKLFIILGIIAGVCILAALVFIILAQMKTSEINKALDLGEKYLEEGKYEEAILAFDDVITIDAKQISAYEGKAEVYVATQKYGEAEKILIEARQIEPSSKTNLLLVEVYDKTEKSDEAEELLEETITLLMADIERITDKTELVNLYDQLISAYQRIGKDSGSIRSLCTQAYEATKDNKYEILMKKSQIGNTSGNSVNDGLVAQQGDWVYYRNSNDNGSLYKIRTDGTEKTKLNSDDTLFINVIDDWVYYRNGKNDSIYKVKTDGTNNILLNSDAITLKSYLQKEILVVGDWVYFNNSDDWRTIYKMKTDGTEKTKITEILACCFYVSGDWIYFSEAMNVGALRKIKTDGSEYTKMDDQNSYYFNFADDWIYYPRFSDQYRLYKMSADGTKEMKVLNEICGTINVVGDWIYFNDKEDNECLYKIRSDGTNKTKLNNEKSYHINVIDNWIYYSTSYDNTAIFKIRTDGSDRQKVE